jgi:hypothetical protein
MSNVVISRELEERMLGAIKSRLGNTLRVMKGTPTTDFSELTNNNSRADDILIEFDLISSVEKVNDRVLTISANYTTAIESGEATWFWWVRPENSLVDSAILYQVAGTISTAAPADLVIGDTNIVAGENYRLTNLVIKLPNSFGE